MRLALRFCLEDVARDMVSKGLISESTMTSLNYDTVISEFKTRMKEKEDTHHVEKHCRLFLTCLSSQGGPAEAVAEDLAEQWKKELQELNVSLSFDVVIPDQDKKQMETELVETNTEMTEHVTIDETEHLETLDIRDHFNELLRQFKNELHGKLSKGEEKLSNITDFVQQLVSTEDLCDVKDLDEVVKKLDCYYNFLDCQIIVLFAKRFASPALLQKFENHSKEAKMFCRSHTIKILQNSFDVNFNSHQANASISLNIVWSNVIIDGLYVLIEQFSVKHGSHLVLKHIKVTELSVHIEYFVRNSSMEIQDIIAHAQEKVSFMCFIGIYEFTINGHTILQVNNEENFTFELALLNAARTGHNEAVQFLLDLTDNTDHCNEEALMLASKGGYEPVVKSLLLAGANVNSQDNVGWTALLIASKYNHITIVHTLLEVGADLDLQISKGANALIIACMNGHSKVVELLLNAQADPNSQVNDGSGLTALMIACIKGHIKVVELLLDRNANPNIQNTDGKTALRFANENGDFEAVDLLLKHHANPNIQDMYGSTELHSAVLDLSERKDECGFPSTEMTGTVEDYIKIIQLLIGQSSIVIDAVNYVSATSLMCASLCGCTEVLLEAGANPNIQIKTSITMKNTMSGLTALMYASCNGHSEVVQLLLNAEAKSDLQTDSGETALYLAVIQVYPDIVQLLLEYGADPNISNRHGATAIHAAVASISLATGGDIVGNALTILSCGTCEHRFKIMKLLIGQPNVKINETILGGVTILMVASALGNAQTVELLLEAGADPNMSSKKTTINKAFLGIFKSLCSEGLICAFGLLEGVELLLKAEANPNHQKEAKWTNALMIAANNGFSDIVQQLLEYGADPNIRDNNGCTAIHYIMMLNDRETLKSNEKMMSDKLEILQLLIISGINVNIKNGNGMTALMIASIVGFTEAVKLLLQAGADPNIEQHEPVNKGFTTSSLPEIRTIGFTALIYGCVEINSDIVNLLLKANANPNQENALGLRIAAGQCYPDIVQQLLKYGADPNIGDNNGCTALHYVVGSPTETPHKDDKEKAFIKLGIIQQLLDKGTNINIQDENGVTALMIATDEGLSEVVELLLQNGADPNIHNNKGWTALMCACDHGNSKVAKGLLRYNANPQLVDNDGFTASIHALRRGNKDLAYEVVIDRDFSQNELKCLLIMNLLEGDQAEVISRLDDITDLTTDKKELLISCVVGSLEDVVGKLHESGLHPDTPLVGGLTLLMIASFCGYIELVEYLVIMEADVNQRDIFWECTPLFYAILGNKSNEIVELLIENGADINAVAGNQTPLDMANSSPVENLTSSLLIEHGGQTVSEMTYLKSEIQPPIKKKYAIFAKFSDQVKSLIQDTVVKREHTEYTHT